MERDQQLAQLREFDQDVQTQPENAQAYGTKGFLEALSGLLEFGLEQQDDGTDNYKEELKVIKDSIKAFSTVLPTVYKTICQNEAETNLWELTRSLMTTVETSLVNHSNTGVRIMAIKCMQVIVLLLSKPSQVRSDHRLLNTQELEKEEQEVFNHLIELLKSDNESVLTATISCLTVIVKKRNKFLKPVAVAFTSWKKTKSKDASPVMVRNVEKALKLAFIALIRTESLAANRSDLIASFGSIGGNVAMFQRHQRSEESRRQKRAAQQQQHDTEREKRVKTEYVPVIPPPVPNILANYDITQIPLQGIVNLCMTVLQTVPLEVMSERVALLPAEGVTLAVSRPGFVRSTTPPYPPPPDQPQYNTNPAFKREEDIKIEEEDTAMPDAIEDMKESKVQVLASVEERASQALKMQPFEMTAKQDALSESDKKKLLKLSIQRIFQAEQAFQTHTAHGDNTRKTAVEGSAATAATAPATTANTWTTNSKNIWILLVAKLITRGTNMDYNPVIVKSENDDADHEMDEDKKMIITDDEPVVLRELLLDFITQDLASRNDLALDWLHEEYLLDKRSQRDNTTNYIPQYFIWFHKLLEKGIPTLDAKDRVLTKVLLDAPELDQKTIDMIKENLESVPERFVPCVSTLRSLVTNRPAVRYMALQVLLDLCTHSNDKMRRTSIVAVKKWNPDQTEIYSRVESFSVESLSALTKKEEETAWTEKDVVRHAELYFVLCTKRPSLLKELFTVYVQATEEVQGYIRQHMINMIKSIGMRSQDMVRLVREFPPGGETLVIRILTILCESKPPTREIISAVEIISAMAEERSIDVSSLSPLLSGHSLASAAANDQTTV